MKISNKIKKLAQEFQETITNKGECGCSNPIMLVTSNEDFAEAKKTPCTLCGGYKCVILVDEDDIKG